MCKLSCCWLWVCCGGVFGCLSSVSRLLACWVGLLASLVYRFVLWMSWLRLALLWLRGLVVVSQGVV